MFFFVSDINNVYKKALYSLSFLTLLLINTFSIFVGSIEFSSDVKQCTKARFYDLRLFFKNRLKKQCLQARIDFFTSILKYLGIFI